MADNPKMYSEEYKQELKDAALESSICQVENIIVASNDVTAIALESLHLALKKSKEKTVAQKISSFCESEKCDIQKLLSEFIRFDDPAKLTYEDTDLSRSYIDIIFKDLISIYEFADSVVIRFLQAAVSCNAKTQDTILTRVQELSPTYDLCVFKLFPEKFVDMGFDALNTLQSIVDGEINITVDCFLRKDWCAFDYYQHRHYLCDENRVERSNILMGYEYIGEETTTTYYMRKNRNKQIQGTAYAELVKDGPV